MGAHPGRPPGFPGVVSAEGAYRPGCECAAGFVDRVAHLNVHASGGNMVRHYGTQVSGALAVTTLTQSLAQISVVILGGLILLNHFNFKLTPILDRKSTRLNSSH